jgi:molybdenum cofactor cytidylyltransferase
MRRVAAIGSASTGSDWKVAAVVLAAGRSRRMGRDKLLLPWGEETVLGATLRNLRQAGIDRPLVVTGGLGFDLDALVLDHGAELVPNPAAEAGEMLGSLQRGLAALPAVVDAVLVMLGDQPMIGPDIIRAVIDAGRRASESAMAYGVDATGPGRGPRFGPGQLLVVPEHEGRWGHPVLFGRDHIPELLALPLGARPRDLLLRRRDLLTVLRLEAEEILADLDTEGDYLRWAPEGHNRPSHGFAR